MPHSLMSYIKEKYSGNVSAFARAMGLKPGRVHQWLSGRQGVPAKQGKRLSMLTGLSLELVLFPCDGNNTRRGDTHKRKKCR